MNEKSLMPIGIIGAMDAEVSGLIAMLEGRCEREISGLKFYTGTIYSKPVVIAKCGVGKVFAAMCASVMIAAFAPALIVNSGVAGGLCDVLECADIVIADKLVQYDMDTSPLGDPKGLISGINRVYFEADGRAIELLKSAAADLSLKAHVGGIATGDRFVASAEERDAILSNFPESMCCEMEGGAVAHASFVGKTPFAVVRAISDGANSESMLDFPAFLKIAAKNSTALTLALIEKY